MAKKRTVILLFFGICVLSCGLLIWALTSPAVDDYYWIHKRGTEAELAFAIALRTNHPAAYEMIDPGLRPRLAERSSATDWARLEAMNDDQIDYSDIPPLDEDFFAHAQIRLPRNKRHITLRRDAASHHKPVTPQAAQPGKRDEKNAAQFACAASAFKDGIG